MSAVKRKSPPDSAAKPKAKRSKAEEANYHLTPSIRDKDGEIVWPAPKEQMEMARQFITEW